LKENGDQGFGGGVETGHTNPPRALPEMGGRTPKSWKKFHLRENIADERQEHAGLNFSRWTCAGVWTLPAKVFSADCADERGLDLGSLGRARSL
jgi:hypothetical protein